MKTIRLTRLLLVWMAGFSTACSAGNATSYDVRPESRALVASLEAEGVPAMHSLAMLADARHLDEVIEKISRTAEGTMTWGRYKRIFMDEKRIRSGQKFIEKHEDVFDRAEMAFGVPREYIAAILGVETKYGKTTGGYRVLDSLATLGFDYPRRSKFFMSELKYFLQLTYENGLDARTLEGSYAGAMGYPQFMPSSYMAYAIDFDGDRVIDIWNSPADAIGSIANYLVKHGWRRGEPVAERAELGTGANPEIASTQLRKPTGKLAALTGEGWTSADIEALDPALSARAVVLDGEEGPEHWVTFNNFYTISRYNHSTLYSMAVSHLAEAIRER
jgi:membrane-bound lytic murein transglycosylase B